MSHLSEKALSLKINKINGCIKDCIPRRADVEFIVLPYFNTVAEIPNKINLYKDINDYNGPRF